MKRILAAALSIFALANAQAQDISRLRRFPSTRPCRCGPWRPSAPASARMRATIRAGRLIRCGSSLVGRAGEYLGQAEVTLSQNDEAIIGVRCGGPWLLVRLAAGTYDVTAVVENVSKIGARHRAGHRAGEAGPPLSGIRPGTGEIEQHLNQMRRSCGEGLFGPWSHTTHHEQRHIDFARRSSVRGRPPRGERATRGVRPRRRPSRGDRRAEDVRVRVQGEPDCA